MAEARAMGRARGNAAEGDASVSASAVTDDPTPLSPRVAKRARKVAGSEACAEDPPSEKPAVEDAEAEAEEDADDDVDEDVVEIDDDPVDLLVAQGVTEEVAKRALERANGDLDQAVMLVVELRQLETEEKEMAKVMEESLREAEEEAAKRDAEDSEKKRDAPAAFFKGSSFLEHLGEDVASLLLGEGSAAKDDVIAMLEFERKCMRWYRNRSREVGEKFAAIAAELVANVGDPGGEGDDGAHDGNPDGGADGGGGGGGGGGDPGRPGGSGGIELVHSMLVAHLMDLQEAVLTMPEGDGGGIPDIFSPGKDAAPEEIDLTVD